MCDVCSLGPKPSKRTEAVVASLKDVLGREDSPCPGQRVRMAPSGDLCTPKRRGIKPPLVTCVREQASRGFLHWLVFAGEWSWSQGLGAVSRHLLGGEELVLVPRGRR